MSTFVNLLLELCLMGFVLAAYLFATKRTPEQIGRPRPFLPVMNPEHHWVSQFMDWMAFWMLCAMNFVSIFVLFLLYTEGSTQGGGTALAAIVSLIWLFSFAIGPLCGLFGTYSGVVAAYMWPSSRVAWSDIPTMQEFWNDWWGDNAVPLESASDS